ncbi:MAG TPA: FtsX-like permease family protein [Anaerolineaceae bacterium]
MIPTRWYKTLHDLTGNKTRTILIILSIAVGLLAVGTIISARSILSIEIQRSYATIHPSNGTVRTLELFQEDFVHSVRQMPGVVEADARRLVDVRVKIGPDTWNNLTIFVIDDYDHIRLNKIFPQAGAYPPPEREILIERLALPLINANIGDYVLIELPNNRQRSLRVAGTVHDMAQIPAQMDNTPYGYITFDTLRWMGEPVGFNELDILTTKPDDKAHVQAVINRVKNKAENSNMTIPLSMIGEPGQLPLDDTLNAILLVMGLLGTLSLFMSAFLIINTITSLLAQQRHQIGIMKAIGASSRQLIGMYLMMVCAYGIIALVISIPASIYASQALSVYLAALLNFNLVEMHIPVEAIVIQIIIGLLVPLIASLYPFLSSLNITAAEAMSIFSIGKELSGKSLIDRMISGRNLWAFRFILMRPVVLAFRNVFRSKRRLILTLATLILAGAIFISVFSVQSSINATIQDMTQWYNFDIMVNFRYPYRLEEITQAVEGIPGIKHVDFWSFQMVRRVRPDGSESGNIYMFAPRVTSPNAPSPKIFAGRWLQPGDENAVVVSSTMVRDEHLTIGDQIIVKIKGTEYNLTIVGISLGVMESMVYCNFDYIARITGAPDKAVTALIAIEQPGQENNANILPLIDKAYKRAGFRIASIITMQEEIAQSEALFSILTNLLLIMAVLLALVGGLGLMGTMSINVLERTREIGVLRAIGASNRNVASVFILEGIVIGLISWALGAIIAMPMGQTISTLAGETLIGSALTYAYSISGMWLWLLLVILLSIFASYFPARNASRLTVREVLNYE